MIRRAKIKCSHIDNLNEDFKNNPKEGKLVFDILLSDFINESHERYANKMTSKLIITTREIRNEYRRRARRG